jgi:hypothetical protein
LKGEGVLGGMMDLREHFGIWDQCGNTRFFQKQNPWSEIYLNPLDGVLVVARRELGPGDQADPQTGLPLPHADPRYTLVIREAERVESEAVQKAFAANQPWVKKAVEKFFYYRAIGWALDVIREHTKQKPLPGDRDLGNFLRLYKSGAGNREAYLREGSTGGKDEPFLEEALEAILRTMTSMEGIIADYGRGLSQADLDEALADRGILECA